MSEIEKPKQPSDDGIEELLPEEPTQQDELLEGLQADIARLTDARREDQFIGIVIIVLLFDIVFFSVMPSFGGPLALLVLELLILIPLAKRMGVEEIATLFDRVLARIAESAGNSD